MKKQTSYFYNNKLTSFMFSHQYKLLESLIEPLDNYFFEFDVYFDHLFCFELLIEHESYNKDEYYVLAISADLPIVNQRMKLKDLLEIERLYYFEITKYEGVDVGELTADIKPIFKITYKFNDTRKLN